MLPIGLGFLAAQSIGGHSLPSRNPDSNHPRRPMSPSPLPVYQDRTLDCNYEAFRNAMLHGEHVKVPKNCGVDKLQSKGSTLMFTLFDMVHKGHSDKALGFLFSHQNYKHFFKSDNKISLTRYCLDRYFQSSDKQIRENIISLIKKLLLKEAKLDDPIEFGHLEQLQEFFYFMGDDSQKKGKIASTGKIENTIFLEGGFKEFLDSSLVKLMLENGIIRLTPSLKELFLNKLDRGQGFYQFNEAELKGLCKKVQYILEYADPSNDHSQKRLDSLDSDRSALCKSLGPLDDVSGVNSRVMDFLAGAFSLWLLVYCFGNNKLKGEVRRLKIFKDNLQAAFTDLEKKYKHLEKEKERVVRMEKEHTMQLKQKEERIRGLNKAIEENKEEHRTQLRDLVRRKDLEREGEEEKWKSKQEKEALTNQRIIKAQSEDCKKVKEVYKQETQKGAQKLRAKEIEITLLSDELKHEEGKRIDQEEKRRNLLAGQKEKLEDELSEYIKKNTQLIGKVHRLEAGLNKLSTIYSISSVHVFMLTKELETLEKEQKESEFEVWGESALRVLKAKKELTAMKKLHQSEKQKFECALKTSQDQLEVIRQAFEGTSQQYALSLNKNEQLATILDIIKEKSLNSKGSVDVFREILSIINFYEEASSVSSGVDRDLSPRPLEGSTSEQGFNSPEVAKQKSEDLISTSTQVALQCLAAEAERESASGSPHNSLPPSPLGALSPGGATSDGALDPCPDDWLGDSASDGALED